MKEWVILRNWAQVSPKLELRLQRYGDKKLYGPIWNFWKVARAILGIFLKTKGLLRNLGTATQLQRNLGASLQIFWDKWFLDYFWIEKSGGFVHGSWTTGTPIHRGLASIADQKSSLELSLWLLWGSMPMAKERGGGSGARGTRWAAHRRPDGGKTAGRRWEVVAVKGLWWGHALVRERK
jgi:hypothetical protein